MEKQADSRVVPIPAQAGGIVTRGEALGSHGTTDAQCNLPRTSSERNRLKSPRRPRRNTLPSLILTEQEAQILAGPKDDLVSQSWRQAEPTPNKFKRRSRSADALNDMVATFNLKDVQPGDRESQIAYWRTSVLENPTPLYRGWPTGDQADTSTTKPPELAPIQTFDFGLEKFDVQRASLEDRVNTLEIKVFDFEYAIARLQGHDIAKPLLHPKAPKRRSIHELFPSQNEKSTLSVSPQREPTSFLNSPDESPMPAGDHDEHFRPDRTSKATTIRPLTARRLSPHSQTPSSSSHPASSQFDQLMEMLKQEQEARRILEQQVIALQKEVEALCTPVYAKIRPMAYPTPSPESVHETPVAQRALHRSPRFYAQKETPVQETSRFSMSDSIDTGTETEDGFQDVYETPQENRFVFETSRGSPLIGVN